MLSELLEWLTPARVESVAIALGGAVIGTFGGAYGGAVAAEQIAAKKARRARIEQEIRDTNAAIELSFTVCSLCIGLKSQHVQQLVAEFLRQQQIVHKVCADMERGIVPTSEQMEIGFVDHLVLENLWLPTSRLEQTVLEKINARGRISQLAISVARCVEGLDDSISKRNALIERYLDGSIKSEEKQYRTFGYPMKDGSVDMTYSNLTVGLLAKTDNCIYFSKQLCARLSEHGKEIKRTSPRRLQKSLPKVLRADFEHPSQRHLMPDPKEFSGWEIAFAPRPRASKGRYFYKAKYILRRSWRHFIGL